MGLDPAARTLAEAFLSTAQQRGDAPALLHPDLRTALTWRQYADSARRAASGLRALGVSQGDTVGLLLSNRPEFHVADVAALLLGATPFSMYNTGAPNQLAHVLADAGARVVVTEAHLLPGLLQARELLPEAIDHIVVVDESEPTQVPWSDLLRSAPVAAVDGTRADLATVVYTSGTAGPPKGVQLTHDNVLQLVERLTPLFGTTAADRAISYLPMAHVAERVNTHYMALATGMEVVCCPSPGDIAALLPRAQPSIFFSPPRVWEKLRAQALTRSDGSSDPDQLAAVRSSLGLGRVRTALVGAAPCAPEVIRFFHDLGIPLREVYGMSETTAVVSLPTVDEMRVGWTGPPLPGTEVRIADDGEVLVRGPLIMAGYRNMPSETAAAIDSDGWLHTGDIGELDGGQLRVIDRKKELIINASGKNMSPANIEARLKESSPIIGQACVIGDGRPYNVALIVLDAAVAAGIPEAERHAAVQRAIDAANRKLSRVEQIKRFAVIAGEWLPGSEELTPTMKLKRKPIAAKYGQKIEALYAEPESAAPVASAADDAAARSRLAR